MLRLALPVVPSTAVVTGNLTNAVLSLVVSGQHFAKSTVDGRRCDSDGIVGDSEVRQDAPSVLKDEMSTRLYHSTDWTPESALWSPSSPSENSASD